MNAERHLVGPIFVTFLALLWSTPGAAQVNRPTLSLSVGSFHHSSDLHPYVASRFDDAVAIGGGVSLPLHRMVATRIIFERVSTRLSGGLVYDEDSRGSDNILAAEIQLIGAVSITDQVSPHVGAGFGVRRYVVKSAILSDDIVDWPWEEPQVQPAFSAIAGVGVLVTRRLGIGAEVRWSVARFRVDHDTWGLPKDPVAWQRELRPALRLEVSPW